MARPARRPYRMLLTFGIIMITLGVAAFISAGHAPQLIGIIMVVFGAYLIASYADSYMSWLEILAAQLARTAHDPPRRKVPHDASQA